ncbi:MAG: ACP S-malonyltransferase [Anaerovoracaceae bacterium]
MKVGIVFAGQGAQYPGMGKDLYDNFERAKEIFDHAGKEVEDWCFEGTKEMLRQTHITQPCIYTVTMAAYKAFMEAAEQEGLLEKMDVVGLAGFSLGEYAALTVAGTIDEIGKGLEIVQKRGGLMQEAGMDAEGNPKGGMAAAFGHRDAILKTIDGCVQGRILEGVNFNSPVQTVVAGEKEALEDFLVAAKENKIKAKLLSVSTAFHSKMMEPAAAELYDILLEAKLKAPTQKVYSNVTAKDMMAEFDGGDVSAYIAQRMAQQAKSPVYWQEIIENMVADGAEVIIEIGPGKTLSGLTKKISESVKTLHVENHESLEQTIAALKEASTC